MHLGDILREIFTKPKYRVSEQIGVTGLPKNIEEDLLRHRQFSDRDQEDQLHQNWQSPNFEIFIGLDDHVDGERMVDMPKGLFQQLDEMMKGMLQGIGDFSYDETIPGLQHHEGYDELEGQEMSPRDKMLKNPDKDWFHTMEDFNIKSYDEEDKVDDRHSMMDWSWTYPFGQKIPKITYHKDHDFDSEIKSGKSNLDDILKRDDSTTSSDEQRTGTFSFGKFSSIITKKRADGNVAKECSLGSQQVIESHKTVKNSDGHEKVTVIRKIGDQAHKKTTVKDSAGNEETQEELMNIDEGDLANFEDAWSQSNTTDSNHPPAFWKRETENDSIFPGGLYDNIKDLFSQWKRD